MTMLIDPDTGLLEPIVAIDEDEDDDGYDFYDDDEDDDEEEDFFDDEDDELESDDDFDDEDDE